MKKIIAAALLITLFSCQKEKPLEKPVIRPENPPAGITEKNPAPSVEYFSFPEEIQGCSCYFAEDKSGFEAQRYIYADDFGKNALLKINGKLIKFPLKDREFNDKKFVKKLHNDQFSIEIEADKTEESEETTMFSGKMTVTAANGESVTMPVYGECGC